MLLSIHICAFLDVSFLSFGDAYGSEVKKELKK
jgi:hypothetical protein